MAQPSIIGAVRFNIPKNSIPVSEKLEINLNINRLVPEDYAEPHNPNVIEMIAIFTKGSQSIKVDAFYDEEVMETGNCNGIILTNEIYPRTKFEFKINNSRLNSQRWVLRHAFRLNEIGKWSLVIKVKDQIQPGAGKFHEIYHDSIKVIQNFGSKGFIGLKKGKKSFLYNENGEMCFMIGMNEHFSNNSENYVCRMRDVIDKVSQNNANLLKMWIDGNPEWWFAPVIQGVAGKSGNDTEFHTSVFNSKNAKMIDIYLDYAKSKNVNIQMVLYDPLNLDDQGYYEGWRRYCPFNCEHDSTYPSISDNKQYYNEPNDIQCIDNPWNFYPPIPTSIDSYKILDYQNYYLRYCASRWSYATNLVAWEIGKEININAPELKIGKYKLDLDMDGVPDTSKDGNLMYGYRKSFKQPEDMVLRFDRWLIECKKVLQMYDASKHLITASPINPFFRNGSSSLYKKYPVSLEQYTFFKNLDISVSGHYYPDPICSNSDNCKKAIEKEESLFHAAQVYNDLLQKPHHIQEWGQGDDNCEGITRTWHQDIDPYGFDLHNVTLSSSFTGNFGSALSFNSFFSIQPLQQYYQYKGIGAFMKQFKDLGNVLKTGYFKTNTNYINANNCKIDLNEDGLRVAYMVTIDDLDSINIIGWCQDKKYSLSNLYWKHRDYLLTMDNASKPKFNNQFSYFEFDVYNSNPVKIEWYETFEGKHLVQFDKIYIPKKNHNRNIITILFPDDLHNSNYADAIFRIKLQCGSYKKCIDNQLFLFPNPASDFIRVSNSINGFLAFNQIKIINSLGKIMMNVENATSFTEFDISSFSNGIYYLSLEFEEKIHTFKIIKN